MGLFRTFRWALLIIGVLNLGHHLLLRKHPCGDRGSVLEWGYRTFGYHDQRFSELPMDKRACLWVAGLSKQMPHNPMSYFKAARTLLTGVQSRYSHLWQDAQSFHLELEVAEFISAQKVMFVSTGTAALVVALQTLGIGYGDEVIVPTYTWVATAAAVTSVGAIPIMADIDETLGMSPESVRAVITNRTKAILPVHMRGVPCDIEALKEVADEQGLFLIEDCAQSFGASVHGKMVGSFGIMGITSVNPSKTFQAGGQGGLVWLNPIPDTNTDLLQMRMMWAVENGIAAWGGLEHLPSFKRSFNDASFIPATPPFAGHCFRSPSEWHAAFLRNELTQLDRSSSWLRELKKTFVSRLDPRFRNVLQRVKDMDGDRSYTITLILWSNEHAKWLKEFLQSEGVAAETDWWRIHYLPHVKALMDKVSFHTSGFPWLTEEDQKPLQLEQFDKSNSIMERTFMMQVSYYFSKGMMEFAGDKVNAWLAVIGDDDYCNLTKRATA